MSDYRPKVIIRTAIGAQRPLHPQHQHVGDYTDAFKLMTPNIEVIRLDEPDQILKQLEGSLFPVPRSALKANISIVDIPKSTSRFSVGSATITRLAMNHPGRGSAYCIEADDAKVAYITDNELYPPYKKETDFIDFAKFAQMYCSIFVRRVAKFANPCFRPRSVGRVSSRDRMLQARIPGAVFSDLDELCLPGRTCAC